ncbi:hypothetical protein ACFE04_004254 [Oxalis oulophora]
MSNRVRCKFFANGLCLKGDHCDYSHDWKAPPNNVCTYYQKGTCAYGSRCRYEHVKVSWSTTGASSSSTIPYQSNDLSSAPSAMPTKASSSKLTTIPDNHEDVERFSASRPLPLTSPSEQNVFMDNNDVRKLKGTQPAVRPLCSFAAAGECPRGENCSHVHGDLCSTCGKHCLHPFSSEERDGHIKMCEKKKKHLEALKHSQEIECNVCLDRVLSKPTSAERKFGLLSECNHSFCITCIRNWRNTSPTTGMDLNTSLRACPICRKLSYFVIPSAIWYTSPEEKQEIVESYKAKLSSIDCKHFNFGNGNCPFGTSCFYRHTVKPGSYVWKYNRPPPRRARARRSSIVDRDDEIFDVFEEYLEEDERDIFDAEDFYGEDLCPLDMAFFLMSLDYDSFDSSDGESYLD